MAGRKDKNVVDYFPHFCNSGKSLFILESKYGNDGYAVCFKTFELLGRSENHYFDCTNNEEMEFMYAKMNVGDNLCMQILNTMAKLNVIHQELWENKIIWSSNFVKNISDVYKRRTNKCMNFYNLLCQNN